MRCILTPDWEQGITDLAARLQRELAANRRVLWLVSGGSNTKASVEIMRRLPRPLTQRLSVSLVDERYGPAGHADSNWTQLLQAGFVPQAARRLPVLQPGATLEQTRVQFERLVSQALLARHCIIAQLGIGDDGHIAGLLPNSPGVEPTTALVVGYQSRPFTRLSLSFAGLRRLTAAYAFAFGANKQQVLTSLVSEDIPPAKQPAQSLKQLHEAYLYNDQVGG